MDRPVRVGEWVCLGAVATEAAHGFAVAARMAPDGDLGVYVPLTRPLTYRALEQLLDRGFVTVAGEERGRRGQTRTIFVASATGAAALESWLLEPVADPDELSLLVCKLVLLERLDGAAGELIARQRAALSEPLDGPDPLVWWRTEQRRATERFLRRWEVHVGNPAAR